MLEDGKGEFFFVCCGFVFGVLIIYDTLGVAEWLGWMRRDVLDDTRAFASKYEKTYCVKL
jgi:hypothetical protein